MNRLLLFSPLLLTGCALFQSPGEAVQVFPEVLPDLIDGAGEAAVNPANPIAWWKIITGLSVLAASVFAGPAAVGKVKGFFKKK